ncbi:MAG: sorbosone dehydrogenase family protein [Bacteroidetes bacterium]|nr:sorbosone dehydrogenase family protein [Bacteroidota bacterium]MCY4233927.1 sorbosone dehydrogenase family protein [Bacteroidota bacterium]
MHRFLWLLIPVGLLMTSAYFSWSDDHLPLEQITLPDGFTIEVYADSVPSARQMALSPSGILYVGAIAQGTVHAVVDRDGDMKADELHLIDEDLELPSGLAYHDGSLYVAAVSRIYRYDDIDNQLDNPTAPVVVVDDLPTERHHGWKFIAFGPDGKLYVPVGAPCNVCEEPDPFATVLRMNADGSEREVYARGIRNSVGFDWHPMTGELWITDNGSDNISPDPAITDNLPSCELNHAPEPGMHFGYPYYHQGDTPDPEFGEGRTADEFTPPVLLLGPHVAPLGIDFYTGSMFPDQYVNHAFIAEHGSWNRREKIGYRVKLVHFDDAGMAVDQEVFAEGWLQGQDHWGRPVDIETLPDGSILVSDDYANTIYRITYSADG